MTFRLVSRVHRRVERDLYALGERLAALRAGVERLRAVDAPRGRKAVLVDAQ